jgi:fumarate reductase subunit C
MGSVIPIRRRRPARMTWQKSATLETRESMQSLLVLVIVFSVVALAMAAAVVIAASNSWAEAVPLIVVVAVIALTKIVLANAAFYVMIRSDTQAEAIYAEKAAAKGVLRQPPPSIPPRSLNPTPSRPRVAAKNGGAKLAVLATKSPGKSPRIRQ